MTGTNRTDTLRWIGDLDHPFYDDERQRFVWYEASAVALQLFFFLNVATAGVMFWIGGASGIPYGIAILFVNFVGSVVTVQYVSDHYAKYEPKASDFFGSSRGRLYLALSVFMGLGLVRAAVDTNYFDSPDMASFVGPLLAAWMGAGLWVVVNRRKKATDVELDEI